MAYRKINFEKVKGFNNLDENLKEVFKNTYYLHNSIQGNDYKEEYEPVEVVAADNKVKVIFKNKVWLYYYPNQTWG